MGVFEHFPYANFHEQNVDWMLKKVKELLKEMSDLDDKMKNIEDDIEDITLEQLQQMVEDGTLGQLINQELLGAINDRVTSIEREIPVHAGNNIVFIGDSWTYGSGATDRENDRFSTLVAKQFEMTEYNFGVGAAGFTRPNTFISQVETANSSMTAAEKNATSIVLIVGGVNDIRWSSETTLSAFSLAVVQCVERAKEVFPNAQVCLALGTTTNDSFTDTNRHWFYYATKAVKNQHSPGRVLIIDHVGAAINGVSANYASDNLHPNNAGHSLLAGFLCNAIQGGGTDTEYYVGTYVLDTNVVTASLVPHVFRQTENVLYGQGIFTLQQEITTNTLIGTYTGPFGYENIYFPMYHGNVPVASFVITSSGNVRIVPYTGVTLSSGWQLRTLDHVELFRTLIE